MEPAFRVLIVCTANVCRSPLAEAVLARRLEEAGDNDLVDVVSAGAQAEPGQPMCRGASARLGVEPTWRESQALSAQMLTEAGLVLALDRTHRAACARLEPACRPRLFTLRQAAALAQLVATSVAQGSVPEGADPLPVARMERLKWLVSEMDAARGTLAGRDEIDDDIEDRHGPAEHGRTLEMVEEAANDVARAMATCLDAPRYSRVYP